MVAIGRYSATKHPLQPQAAPNPQASSGSGPDIERETVYRSRQNDDNNNIKTVQAQPVQPTIDPQPAISNRWWSGLQGWSFFLEPPNKEMSEGGFPGVGGVLHAKNPQGNVLESTYSWIQRGTSTLLRFPQDTPLPIRPSWPFNRASNNFTLSNCILRILGRRPDEPRPNNYNFTSNEHQARLTAAEQQITNSMLNKTWSFPGYGSFELNNMTRYTREEDGNEFFIGIFSARDSNNIPFSGRFEIDFRETTGPDANGNIGGYSDNISFLVGNDEGANSGWLKKIERFNLEPQSGVLKVWMGGLPFTLSHV